MASDGKWCPQRWEYRKIFKIVAKGDYLGETLDEVDQSLETLGQQGWEMVNFTVQPMQTVSTRYEYSKLGFITVAQSEPRFLTVTCYMKRPLAP